MSQQIGRPLSWWRRLVCVLAIGCAPYLYAQPGEENILARVDGEPIALDEFEATLHIAMRQQLFHRNADSGRIERLRVETARRMIDHLLLVREAQRRGIEVDPAALEAAVAARLKEFRLDRLDEAQRHHLKAQLRDQMAEKLLVEALRAEMERVDEPSEQVLRRFYEENLDKFTTPERLRVAVILLRVAPSAGGPAWQAAMDEAKRIRERLRAGADFEALARIHSSDASAEQGGDLGYLHRGMLSAEAQQAVDALAPGEISEPVALLQGIAIFKLIDRQGAEVNPFERVRERAAALYRRQEAERAWRHFLEGLRAGADIEVPDKALEQKIFEGYVSAAN